MKVLVKPSCWKNILIKKIKFYGISGLVPAFWKFKRKKFPIRLALKDNYADQLRKFSMQKFNEERCLKEIKKPVLWLHGTADGVIPFKDATVYKDDIENILTFHKVTGFNHYELSFSDYAPVHISEWILRFFD